MGCNNRFVVDLPHGGGARINELDLVDFIRASRLPRNYIIGGASKVTLAKHHKKHSLDYWLRQRSQYPNTMQAVPTVIDALVATGLFIAEDKLPCPDSHRYCKGLRLSEMVLARINRPEGI
jgi:hypothetical protein